jgi:hypothetical protein
MKKLLLTGVAALMLTAPCAAANVKFKLGPEVLGTWCIMPNNDMRIECSEDDTHDWVTITPNGWHGIESDCKIISGKIIGREAAETKTGRTNPVYYLKLNCYTEGFTSNQTSTIVASKGFLDIRVVKKCKAWHDGHHSLLALCDIELACARKHLQEGVAETPKQQADFDIVFGRACRRRLGQAKSSETAR